MFGSRVSHRNRIVFLCIIIDLNPFNLSDKKDVGKGSQKGKGADKDECGRKASAVSEKADDNRNDNRSEAADKIKYSAGQSDQMLRC